MTWFKRTKDALQAQQEQRAAAKQAEIDAALGRKTVVKANAPVAHWTQAFGPLDPAVQDALNDLTVHIQSQLLQTFKGEFIHGHREPCPTPHSHPCNPAYRGTVVTYAQTHHDARGPHPLDSGRACKRAGIRAGEIIAWRAWVVDGLRLFSTYRSNFWSPDKPMTGRPHPYMTVEPVGVHAFKNPFTAHDYAKERGNVVLGTVKLWGEVIEFERGYRAEFAKINSLDLVVNPGESSPSLEELQSRYKVGPCSNSFSPPFSSPTP